MMLFQMVLQMIFSDDVSCDISVNGNNSVDDNDNGYDSDNDASGNNEDNNFLLVLTNFSFWEEDRVLGYAFLEVVRELIYINFTTRNHAPSYLWPKKYLVKH